MIYRPITFIASLLLLSAATFSAHAAAPAKPILVGYVEKVQVSNVDVVLKAKMDTGAKTSSIDADILDIRKDDDKEIVVFSVEDADGNIKTLEREIARWVRIKRKGGEGTIRRPVITMHFCIGEQVIDEEVNLANREGFIYPVLVGRNMMEHGNLAVDPSKTFTSKPHCETETTE
tara:strand:- start:704 stop:1228 length:525 start_codon:yes stop_codon:yes gene_type:complete